MSNKTRKYIWPVSLAMSLALIGTLAAFVAFGTVGPQPAVAHGPCSDLLSADPTLSELGALRTVWMLGEMKPTPTATTPSR